MGKIVTPMDFAMAGLKVWRVQAQNAALATMEFTELAHTLAARPQPGRASQRAAAGAGSGRTE